MAEAPLRIVLASGSVSRRTMLSNAGLAFDVIPSKVDETALKRSLVADPARYPPPLGRSRLISQRLAAEKAIDVSLRTPDALVIGADQTLALLVDRAGVTTADDLDKPADLAAAGAQLRLMRGRTHVLCSAVAIARNGSVAWTLIDEARLTMRDFSDDFLDGYLCRSGEKVCSSVGAYQLESLGIQLFERIEGDYFTILGLPLLPLLGELRRLGVVPG